VPYGYCATWIHSAAHRGQTIEGTLTAEEPLADGEVAMTFGEEHQEMALELVRWLEAGAELLEPEPWGAALEAQLA
jgi:hypothetical protein